MFNMDRIHQDILRELRRRIVDDMDVNNGIINPLKSDYILRDDDIEKIHTGKTKEEQAQILLDILPNCGPYAFDSFRKALRHHYIWLSEDMANLEASRKSVTCNIKYSGSPNLPPISLTVLRKEKMAQLQNALERLEPHGYIALHGMKGFGKSCLTASMLKDTKLVKNLFNGEVYSIRFGNTRPIEQEILIQLNKLYHLVRNLGTLPDILKPEPLKDYIILYLKCYFGEKDHNNALLILDDVCHKEIIDSFDFECKTLVITADTEILSEKNPMVIQMTDGFTEAETLELFANALETEVDKLPPEAKRIHNECGGMPLLITMFAAQFAEFKHDMNHSSRRWKYYLNCLRQKDVSNNVIKKFFEKQQAIFNMCINQLPSDMKRRYEELAIFSEDVNIMPQTLEILWEGRPFQVDDMMLDLCRKSLAVKQWNESLGCYIYGIHDLLLCHLRENLSRSKLVQMHKSFVEKYRKYCNGDFSKLPRDYYSHSYIGYHLEQAEMFSDFPTIYFNFDFLQAVITHSGLCNLLIDLEKYRKYITNDNDPVYEKQLADLERFLEEQARVIANHRRKKCLDLIQIAMNHPYDGYVRDTAHNLAIKRTEKLYLSHDKKLGHIEIPFTEEISTEISTACFACDPNYILIGNKMGEIYLWDSMYKKQKVFTGHKKNSVIKKIMMSTSGECFLTLSDRGIAKLFMLTDEHLDESTPHAQSPRQKQQFWRSIFQSKIPEDDSYAMFSVHGEIISDVTFNFNDSRIAACTNKGRICIWDHRGTLLLNRSHTSQSCQLKRIAFTMPSDLLHIMDESNGVLISYGKSGNEYTYLAQYNPGLQQKRIIFFSSVPGQSNSLIIVTEDKAVHVKWTHEVRNNFQGDQVHSYMKQIRATIENAKTVYMCAALTCDGQYLVLADSGGFVNVWKTDTGDIGNLPPLATYKSRVSSLDTYWMQQEGYHIICGTENTVLHRWKIPAERSQVSTRKPLFDGIVRAIGKPDIIATQTLSNTVVTLLGDEIIAESEPVDGKITRLHLSSDGNTVIYVTEQGTVSLFDVKKKKGAAILKILPTVELIKILNIENNTIVVCRGSDDNFKVWHNSKITYLVESVGYVVAIHEINKKHILTIARNGSITLWSISGTDWLRLHKVTGTGSTTTSCLSPLKNYLVILNENKEAVVYTVQEDVDVIPKNLTIIENFRMKLRDGMTCCEISQDEKYLAVGFENGSISILDIVEKEQVCMLSFHNESVTQLYWAPPIIDIPILLSVNEDELVWWNIELALSNKKKKRRSHLFMTRSVSTPAISRANLTLQLPNSQSAGAEGNGLVSSIDSKKETDEIVKNGTCDIKNFWKSKDAKDPDQSGVLAVVELPPNFLAKVCISADFTKFLTVDIYGSISTFSLFGFT